MTLWKNVLLGRWLLLWLLEGCSDALPAVCLDRQGQLNQPITVHWQVAGRFPLNPIKLSSLINYNLVLVPWDPVYREILPLILKFIFAETWGLRSSTTYTQSSTSRTGRMGHFLGKPWHLLGKLGNIMRYFHGVLFGVFHMVVSRGKHGVVSRGNFIG